MSNSLKTYLQEENIKQKICSAHTPTGNFLSEKINFDIVTVLKIYKNWCLKMVIRNRINLLYNPNLKETPLAVLLFRKGEKFHIGSNENISNKNRKVHTYKINDNVLLKNFNRCSKLDSNFIGPFVITKIIDSNRIEITDSSDNKIIHNIKNIKPFRAKLPFVEKREDVVSNTVSDNHEINSETDCLRNKH
ncbi:pol polyprotein [Pseudoloma neurophilia]|uniref:Pol polyprotein n=1 Tax=Pseudoloma neurophilia TaxID=146866 RepID=A0A0R0M8C8_9MICR|nr:pol polyprotein [Pseudoloma neurophilia]